MEHDRIPDKHDAEINGRWNPFRNFAINLQATGAAAVLITWIIAVIVVSIWAPPSSYGYAFSLLGTFGGFVFVTLAQKLR